MASKTADYVTLDLDELQLELIKRMLKDNNGRAPFGKIEEAIAKYQSARLADSPEPSLQLTPEHVGHLETQVLASLKIYARSLAVSSKQQGVHQSTARAVDYLRLWGELLAVQEVSK